MEYTDPETLNRFYYRNELVLRVSEDAKDTGKVMPLLFIMLLAFKMTYRTFTQHGRPQYSMVDSSGGPTPSTKTLPTGCVCIEACYFANYSWITNVSPLFRFRYAVEFLLS